MYLSNSPSTCLSVYLSIYLSLSLCLSVCLSVCPSTCLSASLKTKLFCETSSGFELDNIKNAAILRDFLQKWKVECSAYGLVPMRLAICPLHLSCQVVRSAAPVTQNHRNKPTDLMLQNATPLRKSAPWPPSISDEHVFCTAPATRNSSLQILFKCPTPAISFGNATKPSRFAHFWEGAQSLALATRNDTWKSKSGANMWCFSHFDFKMCFARQRRALFRHRNFKKWPEAVNGLHFWLRNVLRATTACTFSTSQLPKVVRSWCVLYILTSTFSTSQLPKGLRAWGVFSFFTSTTACTFSSLIWPDGSAPAA